MKALIVSSLFLIASFPALSQAPAPAQPAEDPAHTELRALRDGMLAAIKKGDIDKELTYLHPNVVVTWQNAEVSRGREGVRKYLQGKMGAVVESYSADLNADELSILYGGDTAVSWGSANEHMKLKDGTDLAFTSRWSATLVKENGQWLVANLHASTNLFDNPMLSFAKRMMYIAAGVALLLGLVAGVVIGRRRKHTA